MELFLGKPIWIWLVFISVVIVLLILDLGFLNKKSQEIGVKKSLWMSAFYISIGLLFGGWIYFELGAQSAKEYITGFVIEKTLAMDNVFVISLIFSYFAIPPKYQHRVLFWGILGVIVLRAIMIGLGATLVSEFSWVLYVFAVFLIITGIKMLIMGDKLPDIQNNPILKLLRKNLLITNEIHGNKFFVKLKEEKSGKIKRHATPLLVALIMVEFVDLIFAVDSVPAIFAITLDPYIVYTSNIFAILGLRALYFALASVIHRFKYLKQALALVLIFIGSKVFIADMFNLMKFPAGLSLAITFGIIGSGILYSLYKTKKEA